jgi:dienelactone hydrolase
MAIGLTGSLVLALAALAGDDRPAQLREQVELATAMLDGLNKGDYQAAGKAFDDTMRKVLTPENLDVAWKTAAQKYGRFRKLMGTRTVAGAKRDLVFLTCQFEKETTDIKVSFDKDKRIAGLFFVPVEPADFAPPPYARPDTFREEAVIVGEDDEWPLPGTLTLPKGDGPFPAVVLLHGSGPQDRDATISANKPLRDLAWGLASQGVVVLRYEKRTKQHAARFAASAPYALKEEVVDDAVAAIALLRAHPKVDRKRVVVVGHSLGAMATPLVGRRVPSLAGVVLLAANSRPLEDVVLDQFEYIYSLKGELAADDRGALERIRKQVARVKDPDLPPDTPSSELPLGIPAFYWGSLRTYDAPGTAARLRMPMLVLQGERDYQVTMADFAGWKKGLSGRSDVTLKSYPALNHLFMEGKGKARPDEYDRPGHVAKEVIDDIAAWTKARE